MKVITVAATKGGVGKSTVAVNIAAEAAHRGMRVLLVDCDLQNSSAVWRDIRTSDDITATSITTPTIHKDLIKFGDAFDLCIVDCGGETISPVLPSAMGAVGTTGLLIIPVLPSVYDVWATEDTLKVLRQVRGIQDTRARFLVNQLMPKRLMSQEVLESLEEFTEEVPAMKSQLMFREAYKKTIKEGKGVVEYTDPKAKAEMICVFDEIMTILDKEGL